MVNQTLYTAASAPTTAGTFSTPPGVQSEMANYIERLRPDASETTASYDSSAEFAVARHLVDRRPNLQKRFNTLAREWREQRDTYSSSPESYAMCMAYQRIIGLGPEAIPLILAELKRHPDHWFWALHALTDANPVPRQKRGIFKEMIKSWLEWGERNGYVFD